MNVNIEVECVQGDVCELGCSIKDSNIPVYHVSFETSEVQNVFYGHKECLRKMFNDAMVLVENAPTY